jgi:hypothetical protein
MSSLRTGRRERVVDSEGYGRLMLVDSSGDTYRITRALLREAGSTRPAVGDAFEFIASKAGAVQLRRVAA